MSTGAAGDLWVSSGHSEVWKPHTKRGEKVKSALEIALGKLPNHGFGPQRAQNVVWGGQNGSRGPKMADNTPHVGSPIGKAFPIEGGSNLVNRDHKGGWHRFGSF